MASLSQTLFHAMCVREYVRPESYDADYFTRGFGEVIRFLGAFDGQLDVAGKTMLDIGCGHGSACIHMALEGARRVVGLDPDERRIAFARLKLATEYPHLADRVEFVLGGSLAAVDGMQFDLIISKDTFEHIPDVPAYVAGLRSYLAPDGRVAIGFGPLWRSLYGGHISYMTRLPWAHLLFPEPVIMHERRRFRPLERVTGFRDFVNQITLREFLDAMASAGLRSSYMRINSTTRRAALIFNLLRRLPFCADLFTVNVYSVWRAA